MKDNITSILKIIAYVIWALGFISGFLINSQLDKTIFEDMNFIIMLAYWASAFISGMIFFALGYIIEIEDDGIYTRHQILNLEKTVNDHFQEIKSMINTSQVQIIEENNRLEEKAAEEVNQPTKTSNETLAKNQKNLAFKYRINVNNMKNYCSSLDEYEQCALEFDNLEDYMDSKELAIICRKLGKESIK